MLHLSWQVCFRTGYRRIFCILKKRTLVSLLWEGGLNSTWMVVYGYVLTAACKCLFFEKVWGWPYLSLFYGCRKHPAFHTSHGTWNQPGQGGLASVAVNSEPLSVSRTWTYLLKSCVPRGDSERSGMQHEMQHEIEKSWKNPGLSNGADGSRTLYLRVCQDKCVSFLYFFVVE